MELLTVKETAQRLRLAESTIRAWILNRKISYEKIGGRVFIQSADIDSLIAKSYRPAQDQALTA